jgi:hypothetical protein
MAANHTRANHPIFRGHRELSTYGAAVAAFLEGVPGSGPLVPPLPVWLGERPDLENGLRLSAGLYGHVSCPEPVAAGVILAADDIPAPVKDLARPLARRWIEAAEIGDAQPPLLVHALYRCLGGGPVRDLLFRSFPAAESSPSFIVGRDAESLSWFLAKQYAAGDPAVDAIGLFTDVDSPAPDLGAIVRARQDFARRGVIGEVLGRGWRRLTFQGHGKDHIINLGPYTVCGRNHAVTPLPGSVKPSCSAGGGCFKQEDKLVEVNRVPAIEIVLSSCNSGRLADLALYYPKYQLLLSALEGPARMVVSSATVHDSGRPENVAWLAAARTAADTTALLNRSLSDIHPYPVFMRFGLPGAGAACETPGRDAAAQRADPLFLLAGRRVLALAGGGLLPPGHWLHPRLGKLARKIDLRLARPTHAASGGADAARAALHADLQSIDYSMTQHIMANPSDELMNFAAYFGDRSSIDDTSVATVRCQCGSPARQFVRRGLLPHILDSTCVVCMRCGDASVRLPEGPGLAIFAPSVGIIGETMDIRLAVRGHQRGRVHVGLFVAPFFESSCVIDPNTFRISAGDTRELAAHLYLKHGMAPQGAYLKAFAVQNMAISIARWNFGAITAGDVPPPPRQNIKENGT